MFDDINGTLNFQDAAFKVVLPTNKAGLFSFFGLGGSSNFHFKDVTPALWQTPSNHTLTLNRQSHLTTALAFSSEGIKDDVFENFLFKIYNNSGQPVRDSIVNEVLNFNGRLTKATYRAEVTYHNKLSQKLKLQLGTKYALHNYKFNQSMLRDSTAVRFTLVNFIAASAF